MKVSKTLIICLSIFFVIITSSMVFAGNTMVDESDDSGNISSLDDNETDDSGNISSLDDNETDDSENITDDIVPLDDNETDDSENITDDIIPIDDNETDDSENITDDIVPIDDNETDDSGNITSVKDNLRTDNNRNEDGQLSYLNKHHTGNPIILALLALSAFCFVSKRK